MSLSESSQQEYESRQKSSGLDPQQFLRSKKRADNYSRKDKQRLIELVTGRLDLLENKISNTSVNLQKAQCWVEIATEYNRSIASTDNWRDDRQLKDLWKRMKFTARSDLIRYVRQKEQEKSSRNDEDTTTNNNGANEILDDFTLILLRLVPAHFQMDTDGKVLQVIDKLLALSPAEVEEQKVLSRNRRQLRRQQMMEDYGNNNQDEDEEDDEDAVVLLEINNRLNNSPDDETVVILDSCLSSNCASNPTASGAGSQVPQVNERLNGSPQETFYAEAIVNPQSVTAAMGGLSHRSQVIDVHPDVENAQLPHQSQMSSQSLMTPMSSASTTQIQQQLHPPPPPTTSNSLIQQQSLNDEPMFTFKSENDPIITESTRQQNWYIEQIGSRNQFEDNLNDSTVPAGLEKDYQYRRKRKTPFYRTLLEDEQSEEMRQQLIEMARKENEKELQLLDVQTQCEKQRLVREKMETENAVLKQRLLLQMLQSHINKEERLPSISLLL